MGLGILKRTAIFGALLFSMLFSGCGRDNSLSFMRSSDITANLKHRYSLHVEKAERKRYAVLINGDDSELHKYNIFHAYKTLRSMNFKQEDIFILSINNPRDEQTLDNSHLITDRANKNNLEQLLDGISKIADDNDLLLVYCTGHGTRKDNVSWLDLEGEDISAKDYRTRIEKINAELIINVMDQCYSGGFTEELNLSRKRILTLANTLPTERDYCKVFSQTFWEALSKSADLGYVSFEAAYEQAMKAQGEEHKAENKIKTRLVP